jgi:hypothetical protein
MSESCEISAGELTFIGECTDQSALLVSKSRLNSSVDVRRALAINEKDK